eukprot:12162621-Prorocentrum_lima.AAC.1
MLALENIYQIEDESEQIDMDLLTMMGEVQYEDKNLQEPCLPDIPPRDDDPAADLDKAIGDI